MEKTKRFPGGVLEPGSRREKITLSAAAAVAFAVLLLDQGTKIWIERAFRLHESRPLIDGWLSFTSVRNHGAAWSMLSGQTWLLLLVALAAFAAILYFFRRLAEGYPERYFAQFLTLSGIIGNSIDRLWRGAVVDFIDVHYYTHWSYPVFNVADIAICTGVGLYVLSTFLRPERKPRDAVKDEDR
ncbi:MAG: signal peptidase II [Lentisphaeria bacterium]|nr:signal peptidase II [Lentisphaeria bacterium]